jgi:hypothetical protein
VLRHAATRLLALPAAGLCLAGCGFIGASDVSHTKPDGFVLRGQVSVPAAGAAAAVAGTPCVSALPDVAAGVPVKVSDAQGRELATGELGGGVVVTATGRSGATCAFPFEIRAVPGGVSRYAVSLAGRPAQTFPATELREGQQAVIVLTS